MATQSKWDPIGDEAMLEVEEGFPGCVDVYYVSDRNPKRGDWKKILRLDNTKNFLEIFPLNTWSDSDEYLKGKYVLIESITVEGFSAELPNDGEDAAEMLSALPAGFIKDYRFGLGLKRDYRFIVEAIEENPEIRHLVLTKTTTRVQDNIYFLNEDDFHTIRKAIDRTTLAHQRNAQDAKRVLTHNALLTEIDPETYPLRETKYTAGSIVKFVSGNKTMQASLSSEDKKASLELVRQNALDLVKTERKELLRLKEDIEVVTLQELIQRFEGMLDQQLNESRWQSFFTDNPFILSLAFGYPVLKIGEQISVGGLALSGRGVKITDFLMKSSATNNLAVVEIKTSTTLLFNATPYREKVYSSSKDLSGSVNQVLDQKYQLQKSINSLKADSELDDIEAYSVAGIVVIGVTPKDKSAKKTFELIRSASKDVLIVTFDELLHKLKSILEFLEGATKIDLE